MENPRPNQLTNVEREDHVFRSQIVHNPGYITKLAPGKPSLISTKMVKPVKSENAKNNVAIPKVSPLLAKVVQFRSGGQGYLL